MKNRWLIALAAIGIHICIGSVYSWSVFTKPLIKELGVSLQDVQWTFSIAIGFLGVSAAILGKQVERYGPRAAGLFSAICFAGGMLGAGFAVLAKNLYLLYFFYGMIGGIGLGTGYIAPVSTLVKWFPAKRGMATGAAIMGFGFASLIAAPIIQGLIEIYGLASAFFILGFIYLFIMIPSALYLEPPNKIDQLIMESDEVCPITGAPQFTAKEATKTWQFYALWLLLCINITCGIGILSVASPMGQEVAGMSAIAAATMVGLIGCFNGFGRITWASVSDYIGRPNTFIIFFLIEIVAFPALAYVSEISLFQVLIFLIMTTYGGGFAIIPAFISDFYGARHLGTIHGYILTAWSAAGVIGPVLVAHVRAATGSYAGTLNVFAFFFVVALAVALLVKLSKPPQKT